MTKGFFDLLPARSILYELNRITPDKLKEVFDDGLAGLSASDLCRKHGISGATFYKWRSRFGGMVISDGA